MADLSTTVCGIDFPNPVWTAAGPTGASGKLLCLAAEAGAGGLVAKTISVRPARVPIPNIASPFPGSLLNAELWSEINYQRFIDTEFPQAKTSGIPVVASLGYTPDELTLLGKVIDASGTVDALEFSIHYVGKDVKNLTDTAEALKSVTSLPVLAKLSPAVSDITATIKALDPVVDGFVAINSLGPALDFNIETLQPVLGSDDGRGWLSGRAILPVGLHFVATIAALTTKPVIGVGGIKTAEDIIKYIMAGASAVQICSAAILQGEKIYATLTRKMSDWMDRHGYQDLDQLKGAFRIDAQRKMYYLGQGPQLYPDINYEKCNFCDLCTRSCMYGAIRFTDKKYDFEQSLCVSCGLCTTVCPTDALLMIEEK